MEKVSQLIKVLAGRNKKVLQHTLQSASAAL